MTDAATNSAMQTLLTSVAQALPTNGTQQLVSAAITPVPTTPASPLQVVANTILPVINPNAYKVPVPPTPWYKKTSTLVAAGASIAGLLLIAAIMRRKKRK